MSIAEQPLAVVRANGKIYLETPFRRAFVQPAAGDAGGALGAAYALWHELREHVGACFDTRKAIRDSQRR